MTGVATSKVLVMSDLKCPSKVSRQIKSFINLRICKEQIRADPY